MAKKQDKMTNFVENIIVEVLRDKKFSTQTDKSTIYNQTILAVHVRFIYDNVVRQEMLFTKMLFIKIMPKTTCGEDIFNQVFQ